LIGRGITNSNNRYFFRKAPRFGCNIRTTIRPGTFANPNNPPKRVLFGPQTTDEMGELWIQAAPRSRAEFNLLTEAYNEKELRKVVVVSEYKLKLDPRNVSAHLPTRQSAHPAGRTPEALDHFRAASELEPKNDQPHYFMGVAYGCSRIFRAQKRNADRLAA